ncbi:hypothetical protein TWF281_005487 [Arthrobotrys megalospora]
MTRKGEYFNLYSMPVTKHVLGFHEQRHNEFLRFREDIERMHAELLAAAGYTSLCMKVSKSNSHLSQASFGRLRGGPNAITPELKSFAVNHPALSLFRNQIDSEYTTDKEVTRMLRKSLDYLLKMTVKNVVRKSIEIKLSSRTSKQMKSNRDDNTGHQKQWEEASDDERPVPMKKRSRSDRHPSSESTDPNKADLPSTTHDPTSFSVEASEDDTFKAHSPVKLKRKVATLISDSEDDAESRSLGHESDGSPEYGHSTQRFGQETDIAPIQSEQKPFLRAPRKIGLGLSNKPRKQRKGR